MSSHEPHLTADMRRALIVCRDRGEISSWDYSSHAIGALKKRGLITSTIPGKGSRYVLTESGRTLIGDKQP